MLAKESKFTCKVKRRNHLDFKKKILYRKGLAIQKKIKNQR